MKKFAKLLVLVSLLLAMIIPTMAVAKSFEVTSYETLVEAMTTVMHNRGAEMLTIELKKDIDVSSRPAWEAPSVHHQHGGPVTFNGNGHTITGMKNMLFSGTWAGKTALYINDLTLKKANIVVDPDNVKNTVGVGAFIGYPQASSEVELNNCHLIDSHVEGGNWVGGLIGTSAGYNGNDGPVFMNLLINGCSVVDSTIKNKGSAGGVIGHGAQNSWTKVIITNTTVTGNTITSNDDSDKKAGDVMGTIGVAGSPTTSNGVTKTGGIYVNAQVSNNKVTSNGTEINRIFGRGGSKGGVMYITGGSYDTYRGMNSVVPDDNTAMVVVEEEPVFLGEAKPAVPTYSAPKTGDNSQLLLWAGMMIVAVIGMVAFGKKRAATER